MKYALRLFAVDLRTSLFSLLLLGTTLVPFVANTQTVSAHHCFGHDELAVSECLDAGACGDTQGASCPETNNPEKKLNGVIRLVLNIFSVVVGVVAVMMIIVGGLKYITSSGDPANVSGAKNTILYAVIGLVVVAMAQFIVRFVLAKVSKAGTPPAG